jgi:hypothetical protein
VVKCATLGDPTHNRQNEEIDMRDISDTIQKAFSSYAEKNHKHVRTILDGLKELKEQTADVYCDFYSKICLIEKAYLAYDPEEVCDSVVDAVERKLEDIAGDLHNQAGSLEDLANALER